MQYSLAALRALLLGLAGSCQVAAFGTMPDLSAIKGLGEISTKGESAGGKYDTAFCTNIKSKNSIGTQGCWTIKTEGECGNGFDTYKQGNNDPNKYDTCKWDPSAGTSGKCKLSGYTYTCAPACFNPIAESTEDENGCGANEVYVPCGDASDCVSTEYTAVCDKSYVTVWSDAEDDWVVQETYKISLSVSGRRLEEGARRELTDTYPTCAEAQCKGVISTTPSGDGVHQLVTEEKCKCGASAATGAVSCSCETSTVLEEIPDTTEETTAANADCTDTDPIISAWAF